MSTETSAVSADTPGALLVREFLTAFVGGNTDAVGDLVTEDCVLHRPRWPLDVTGRTAIVEATGTNEGTFADLDIRLEDAVVADDRIAVYATASGRNVGPVRMGEREIAPTGRTFAVPQFGHYRLREGKIAEAWILADALGIVQQLGNFPAGPVPMVRIALRQLRWRLGGRNRLD